MGRALGLGVALLGVVLLRADGPVDNVPDKVRSIPPVGIKLDDKVREELRTGLAALEGEIRKLTKSLQGKAAMLELLPDVEIFHKAVRYAVEYNEFFAPGEIGVARKLLEQGIVRARQLADGKPAWVTATGLIVRGYRSGIDGSVQPYGLVVPDSYRASTPFRHRLDVWLHGRGEKTTELNFLAERQRFAGQFTPRHAFVLHPFGRYCNAFKFAGEIDVLEALAHARRHYSIDPDRLVLRGFSMGGAGCWQLAAHYPDQWVAAAPGAGFSETPDFLRVFQKEDVSSSPWYEKTLYRLHDCPGWAGNFFNLPVVAYSGEKDRQKQAADMMAPALLAEDIDMVHLIGPNTEHSYHPAARAEIDRRINHIAERGRNPVPPRVKFVTYTLRYNRSYWVQIDALGKHWEKATVDATIVPEQKEIVVRTENVTSLTLAFGPGECPLLLGTRPSVVVNGRRVEGPRVKSDRSWRIQLNDPKRVPMENELGKQHGLQGPIDDAFMDSFLMVLPTGKAWHERTANWVKGESAHAIEQWRKQFRGEARVKLDTEVTEEDIARHTLVLWGDPASNRVLARLVDRLPIRWTEKSLELSMERYSGSEHVPVMIYPNPLNPRRYVVLNSGFTYREYDYLNNARQTPKLPDFAILDVRTPPSSRWPGKILQAGFFDERWQVPAVIRK